jgi:hypothetical protein
VDLLAKLKRLATLVDVRGLNLSDSGSIPDISTSIKPAVGAIRRFFVSLQIKTPSSHPLIAHNDETLP